MSSRFLNSGSIDLSALQNGSFELDVASAKVQNVVASLPAKFDGSKQLV